MKIGVDRSFLSHENKVGFNGVVWDSYAEIHGKKET